MTMPLSTQTGGAGLTGMDINAVRQLGANLQNQASQLDQVIQTVNKLIMSAQQVWRGPDAMRFTDEWNSQFRPQLQKAMEEVRRLGMTAVKNAAEQESASR